jgi:NADH-quinone oxidoreductase subunit G
VEAVPHLGRIDEVPRNVWQPLPPGDLGRGPFRSAVRDFYLSNPIARSSPLMAELSAAAAARTQTALAAE